MSGNPSARAASEAVERHSAVNDTEQANADAKPLALLRALSLNDVLATAYLCGLNLALVLAEPSSARTKNQWVYGCILFGYLMTVSLVRLERIGVAWLRAFLYRTAQLVALLGTYLLFREFLPVANPNTLDIELYRLDLALFGVEPAMWLDSFVTPFATEWFAFFYYSYFILMCAHVFPVMYFSRHARRVAEFGLGMTIIATVGHTLYVLVPGYGPYYALESHFQTPLPSGFWWDTVLKAVETGGALKDIFPSMHTAFPSFIVLFSFRHRQALPYRFSWPIVAFIVLNIIFATMYLRWHYLIDVVAGLALAVTAFVIANRATAWETEHRRQQGIAPVWPSWR